MTVDTPTMAGRRAWRTPVRLFVGSLVAFVVFLPVAAISFPEPFAADMTATQLDEMGLLWPLLGLLWTIPIWLGAAAILLSSRMALVGDERRTTVVRMLAVLSAAAMTTHLLLWVSLTGADVVVGDTLRHQAATIASLVAVWSIIPATGLVALALRTTGVLGRSGVVIAIICGVYLLVDVLTWLPVLTGSVELSRGGGIPPFLIAIIWCALGILLTRRTGVRSEP